MHLQYLDMYSYIYRDTKMIIGKVINRIEIKTQTFFTIIGICMLIFIHLHWIHYKKQIHLRILILRSVLELDVNVI